MPPRGAESIAEVRRISLAVHMLVNSLSLKRAEVPLSGAESVAKTPKLSFGEARAGREFVAKKSRSVAMRC